MDGQTNSLNIGVVFLEIHPLVSIPLFWVLPFAFLFIKLIFPLSFLI
jgi:hypothetical protein